VSVGYLSLVHILCRQALRLLILAPGSLVLNQTSHILTKGETLTAPCYSGNAKQTTFNCLSTQLSFQS